MRRALVLIALVGLATGGCGSSMARVKGRLVNNDQPMSFPPTAAAVIIAPIGADGKPDQMKSFTAVVNEDGTFELLASGGELPPGQYQIAIQAPGKLKEQLKKFAVPNSSIRRELKPGSNELVIDVAKPEG